MGLGPAMEAGPPGRRDKLGLEGPMEKYTALGHGGNTVTWNAMRTTMTLIDRNGKEVKDVPVYCYNNPIPGLKVEDWRTLKAAWPVVGPAPIFLELRSTPTPLQKMELDPVQAPILATGASSDPVPLQLQIKHSSLLFRSLHLEKILLF